MKKQILNSNSEVTQFLDEQKHPFRNDIEYLRNCILSLNECLIENIKWNAPNYLIGDRDIITMRIQPKYAMGGGTRPIRDYIQGMYAMDISVAEISE